MYIYCMSVNLFDAHLEFNLLCDTWHVMIIGYHYWKLRNQISVIYKKLFFIVQVLHFN